MPPALGNAGFIKKVPGIIKLCQLALGLTCLTLSTYYSVFTSTDTHIMNRSECFFLLTTATYFSVSFLIVLSSLVSVNTEIRLRQTLFEPLYHGIAAIMYLSASVAVLVEATSKVEILPNVWTERKNGYLAAGGIGIVNSILYTLSTYDSCKAYINE